MPDQTPLFCARCLRELRAGRGEFYQVRIEAAADPSPPELDAADLEMSAAEARRSWEELAERMQELSAREAMDQVARQLTICLCNACYRSWIEDPGGAAECPADE